MLFFNRNGDLIDFMQAKHIRKLNSISEVLRNSKKQSDQSASSLFKCIQLNQNWTRVVGAKWGRISKPVGYNHRCLTVSVPSACHIQEMSYDKENFIEKINKFSGSGFVQDIRWISS